MIRLDIALLYLSATCCWTLIWSEETCLLEKLRYNKLRYCSSILANSLRVPSNKQINWLTINMRYPAIHPADLGRSRHQASAKLTASSVAVKEEFLAYGVVVAQPLSAGQLTSNSFSQDSSVTRWYHGLPVIRRLLYLILDLRVFPFFLWNGLVISLS